jgi:hypothetical protein
LGQSSSSVPPGRGIRAPLLPLASPPPKAGCDYDDTFYWRTAHVNLTPCCAKLNRKAALSTISAYSGWRGEISTKLKDISEVLQPVPQEDFGPALEKLR